MRIDHLGHSGFLAETDEALLLFDYSRGDLSCLGRAPEKPLYVFVSHAHGDHFNPAVFSLSGSRPVLYLLAFDLRGNAAVPADADVRFLDADETYAVPGLGTVRTLLSTDEGAAFLVETGKETLFHAGDLHWWDWPGEDPEWLNDQQTRFTQEIGTLADVPVDAAFIVLDDRLEEHYANGLGLFLSVCRARYVLPMHFWKDKSVVDRFKEGPARASDAVILDTAHETHWEL
jgi:L-ascorbate metabolism protein UlaG (beta-lactamase superfamily)